MGPSGCTLAFGTRFTDPLREDKGHTRRGFREPLQGSMILREDKGHTRRGFREPLQGSMISGAGFRVLMFKG